MKKLEGLYLVVDPQKGFAALKPAIRDAIKGGVNILQVWDHWAEGQDKAGFIRELTEVAGSVPVLINNHLELAELEGVSGIHLDNFADLDRLSFSPEIVGITLSDGLDWDMLNRRNIDYISFCSMYPSSSTDACKLVDAQVVRDTCKYFKGSVFASGGITHENIHDVLALGVSGIAMISGILKAQDPFQASKDFSELINKHEKRIFQ